MMKRRDFLKGIASTAAIPSIPGVVYAEPVSLATVSAAFSLASAVTGFMTRSSNPNIPLFISIAQASEALGMKIDGIDHKLDVMLEEIFAIRRLIENLPYDTNLLGASVKLREPYTAFLEFQPDTQIDRPSPSYLRDVPPIRNRMRSARIKYLDLVGSQTEPGFEAVIQLALAQDAELLLAAEMQRPEMHDLGLSEDIRGIVGTLKAYGAFFDAAVDPDRTGSLTSVKASIVKRIENQLEQHIQLGGSTSKTLGNILYNDRVRILCETYRLNCHGERVGLDQRKGRSMLTLVNDGGFILVNGCGSWPPPTTHHAYFNVNITGSLIASIGSSIDDTLRRPVLYEIGTDTACRSEEGLRRKDEIDKAIQDLNHEVVNYYKIHYAHGVCELARDINAAQQRILHDLI